MVAKCLAVAAWHFATKIPSERGARIWQIGARIWQIGARREFEARACSAARYAAGLGESTRLEVSGWIVIVWKRFAM